MKTNSRDGYARWVGLTLLVLPWCGFVHAQAADAKAGTNPDPAAEKAKEQPKEVKPVDSVQVVTVTAGRRAEPLQTAPISATVLTGDDLARSGVNVVDQLQFATPSATVNNFGQGINFNIRGIGKAETNTQTTTGVVTYRDGVATFPGYFAEEPYFDIASVQVLRGPQGTFGGQNATGGAVLVESNDPVIKGGFNGYVAAQAGNYKDLGFQGAVNLPISSTLAARVAFNTESRDSFWTITGPYTGGNGQLRAHSGRIGLLWQPIKALTVLFKNDYNHIDMGAYPADPVNSPNDPLNITANAFQKALDRFDRSVLKIEYTFDGGTKFRSISGYQHGNTAYAADLDGTSAGNWTFRDSVDETIYSQEFNLISPDRGPLTWVLGAYGQKDTYTFPPGEYVIGVPPGNPATEYTLHGTNPKQTLAVFGQLGYQLSNDVKLVVEGRSSKSTTTNDVSVVQYGTTIVDQQSATFKNFSGKIAVDWTLSDKQFLYAFVANAFRPGGLNVPVNATQPDPFKEEKVKTVEAGWKAIWLDGRVQTQTGAYFNHYENFQVTIGYPNFPVFKFELNTPEPAHIYGFEEQVQAQLGDGWSAHANLGWMHSEIGRFYASDPRVSTTTPCDPATGPASAGCADLTGHRQTGRADRDLQHRGGASVCRGRQRHHAADQLRAHLLSMGHLVREPRARRLSEQPQPLRSADRLGARRLPGEPVQHEPGRRPLHHGRGLRAQVRGRAAPVRRASHEILLAGAHHSMFCTCSRICSINTFISTDTPVSSSAADFEPSVLASRCSSWIRKSRRLPSSPPPLSRRAISSRCARRRESSSATSMRSAKVAASFIARSRKASVGTLPAELVASRPPVAFSACVQRSRKRCCWRSTTAGTSGSACVASSRSRTMRSVRIATSFSPSRARASLSAATARRAASISASSTRPTAAGAERHHCNTSCTLSTWALGSQPVTVPSRRDRRLSWSGVGCGQSSAEPLPALTRMSTLPRRQAAATSSRSAPSCWRSSSGMRKATSRNRLFTDRSSTVTAAASVEAAPSAAAAEAAVAEALPKPVML